MKNNNIKIDIVSDVACPWCYIGKRRLEQAIKLWKGKPLDIEWHPYQLDPSMPAEGKTRDNYLVDKFGSIEAVQEMTDRLSDVGKSLGINLNFGKEWLAVNTLPLHQLLEIAGQEGFKDALKERFFKAYFVSLEPLNDLETLCNIMTEFGWEPAKTIAIINDPEIGKRVEDKISHFKSLGVTGVPFFVINNTYGISGAQTPETIVKALTQAVANENGGVSEAQSCGSGCDC